jgi:hypothetical protein
VDKKQTNQALVDFTKSTNYLTFSESIQRLLMLSPQPKMAPAQLSCHRNSNTPTHFQPQNRKYITHGILH